MDIKTGVLNKKLKNYYEDADLTSYRQIFLEAIINYKGNSFNKILDIGSGIGVFLDSIEPFGYDRYALEASEYGLERLKEKNISHEKFFLEKNKKLPFKDNEFSFILFNQVIEHLEKDVGQYYIQEIVRILEPGGVAIIKSPSKYCKIWRTDPNHIYCWRPNELLNEVKNYGSSISEIKVQRVALEPWMFFNYNDNIINIWHKYNKYPTIKRLFQFASKVIDKILYRVSGSDRMLAVSNITFVKKIVNIN
jgi:SAM-dependent methyltransferase